MQPDVMIFPCRGNAGVSHSSDELPAIENINIRRLSNELSATQNINIRCAEGGQHTNIHGEFSIYLQ